MVEQTGEEIDWDRIPPDVEDFPDAVITALNIYNSLGNRVYPDIGYVGKDYTNLELLYKLYYIEKKDKDFIFEILLYLESIEIDKSQRRLKAEYDKIKRG
jgi:hypothetical protein